MPLQLSDSDLKALTATMRVLVAPTSFGDLAAWRKASAEAVMRLTGADGAGFTLPVPGTVGIVGAGCFEEPARDRLLATYQQSYHQRSLVELRRLALRRSLWVRRALTGRRELEATQYFQEWCRPTGTLDSAGMATPAPAVVGGEVLLHVTALRPNRFDPGGRAEALLGLLQPAFEAGVRAALLMHRWLGEFESSLDLIPEALILASASGQVLHANPPAVSVLRASGGTGDLARSVEALAVSLTGPRSLPCPVREIRLPDGTAVLRASLIEAESLPSGHVVLISIGRAAGPLEDDPAVLVAAFGLTRREAQVAIRLSAGDRNSEIAAALGVTQYTARRHTEAVLRKLGVRSRSAVAAAIRRPPLARPGAAPR